MRGLRLLAAIVVGALAGLAAVFMIGMRTKAPLVQNAVRRFTRDVTNPRQMKSAGGPGAYAAVVKHQGRRTGQAYETPVGAIAADGEFVIALPYGPGTDWCRNVIAAGSATLVHEGHLYEVDQPEIVAMETVASSFPASDQRMFRWFRVVQCLKLRGAEIAAPVNS